VERGLIKHKPTDAIFHVEIDMEADGRWLAEITDLPGVMAYGASKDDAIRRVYVLAQRVLADR
jgi:predicted RNase H-like HicB family nuclease